MNISPRPPLRLGAISLAAMMMIAPNWIAAHCFQEVLPRNQRTIRPTAQNQESPEWAKKAAAERNAPGFSAMRIFFESSASIVRMFLRVIVLNYQFLPKDTGTV